AGTGGDTGSDLWDSSWGVDNLGHDAIYSGWGDGIGFAGTQKYEMGISTLSGLPDSGSITGADVSYGVPSSAGECHGLSAMIPGGKPEGMLALPGGVFYLHHSIGTQVGSGGGCSNSALAKSTDGAGRVWTDHIPSSAPIQWPDANGFSPETFLQYGK